MLTPMQVQYLVGLCCLRRNPDAVDVTLGDWVYDDSIDKKRDVDVTVTVTAEGGKREAIAGFEVRKEAKPLDVTDIEQLAAKMCDMPSLTHRSIVSASGYYSNCLSKASKHGIVLYDLAPWKTPVQESFPSLHLDSTPANSMLFSERELVWLDGVSVKVNPTDTRRELWVGLSDEQSIFDPEDKLLGNYSDLIRRVLAQTSMQLAKAPKVEAVYLTPRNTSPNEQPDGLVGQPVLVENHLLTIGEPIFVNIDGGRQCIHEILVSGEVQWTQVRKKGIFHIMCRHDDPTNVFAGAAVCEVPSQEGLLMASIFSPTDTKMAIHKIQLSEKHKNMIRHLKLRSTS